MPKYEVISEIRHDGTTYPPSTPDNHVEIELTEKQAQSMPWAVRPIKEAKVVASAKEKAAKLKAQSEALAREAEETEAAALDAALVPSEPVAKKKIIAKRKPFAKKKV